MHRFAVIVAVATFVLVLAGGTVTSTQSGDDVPTWPFPIAGFGIELEHRHIAGVVGLLTMVLAGWLWMKDPRAWVRRVGVAAVLLVLFQAGLGGLRVLWGPAAGTSAEVAIIHAVTGQLFFCVMVLLALFTAGGWIRAPGMEPAGLLVSAVLLAQLVLGAVVRHTGAMVLPHVLGAVAVIGAVFWVARRLPMSGVVIALVALALVQAFLGAGAMLVRMLELETVVARAVIATAHVGVGALMLAAAAILSFRPNRSALSVQLAAVSS